MELPQDGHIRWQRTCRFHWVGNNIGGSRSRAMFNWPIWPLWWVHRNRSGLHVRVIRRMFYPARDGAGGSGYFHVQRSILDVCRSPPRIKMQLSQTAAQLGLKKNKVGRSHFFWKTHWKLKKKSEAETGCLVVSLDERNSKPTPSASKKNMWCKMQTDTDEGRKITGAPKCRLRNRSVMGWKQRRVCEWQHLKGNNATETECELLRHHLMILRHVKLCLGSLAGTRAHPVT